MQKAVSRTPVPSLLLFGSEGGEADSVQGGREDVLSHVASMVFSRCPRVSGGYHQQVQDRCFHVGVQGLSCVSSVSCPQTLPAAELWLPQAKPSLACRDPSTL